MSCWAWKGDEAIGRALLTTLASLPPTNPATFEDAYNDALMVNYVSDLVKNNLAVADKVISNH